MKRKRFIKLLMAKWYDRNHANELAFWLKEPYDNAYRKIKEWYENEYWN